jgi:KUP system potassium uptake protein
VRLGYAPRLRILHTSGASVGQIYAPMVNAILFVAVVGLVLGFGSSSRLAAAFGLAVTATMVLTTLMIGYVIFRIWRWNRLWAVPLYGVLLLFDLGLFAASATKFAAGGWLPASVAVVLVIPLRHLAQGSDPDQGRSGSQCPAHRRLPGHRRQGEARAGSGRLPDQ